MGELRGETFAIDVPDGFESQRVAMETMAGATYHITLAEGRDFAERQGE